MVCEFSTYVAGGAGCVKLQVGLVIAGHTGLPMPKSGGAEFISAWSGWCSDVGAAEAADAEASVAGADSGLRIERMSMVCAIRLEQR